MSNIAVGPGRTAAFENPLNFTDVVPITLDWSAWLPGSDTISSVSWNADSGLTVSGTSNTTTTATANITAGSTAGTLVAECQITTAAGSKRTVALQFTVENLQ